MRMKFLKFTLLVVLVEILALYYSWKFISKFGSNSMTVNITSNKPIKPNRHLSKIITVILRNFELQENDVSSTVDSILNLIPNVQIFVLSDGSPYPPLDLINSNTSYKNVKFIDLLLNLNIPFKDSYPLFSIKTKYVLFIPDAVRFTNRQSITSMINENIKYRDRIIASPVATIKNIQCLSTDLNVKEWTLKYKLIKNDTCDSVIGRQTILIETQLLKRLPNAFMLPFPESLYIQTTALNYKVKLVNEHLVHEGKQLLRSHHSLRRHQSLEVSQQRRMYQGFSIKKVVQINGDVEWYGCHRDTPRCFGTVLDSKPSYLYLGKWTPPCCLYNLRHVARHALDVLDESGVRYWLDGESLLGALRSADILPWDYDVDIGINRDDIHRCESLIKAKNKQYIDNQGFVWEKATEGEFYRVHFSKINRLYVNILPFLNKNGTMVKDMWFINNKNMEFPEHFLHPMSTIEFIGRQVPSPNNIRDFLELKFGKNYIENPQQPDLRKNT